MNRPKREFDIVMSGQFRTLAMFLRSFRTECYYLACKTIDLVSGPTKDSQPRRSYGEIQ